MRAPALLVACACALAASTAFGQEASSPARNGPLSPAGYAATLSRLATAISALDESQPDSSASMQTALASLPPVWHVRLGDRDVAVSTDWIRRAMHEWEARPDRGARLRLVEQLRRVGAEASAAEAPAVAAPGAHVTLDNILAQAEFKDARGPSAFDRLLARVARWLLRVVGAAVTSSTMSVATDILVYGLIAAGVALVAIVMYRAIRHSTRLEPIHLEPADAPARVRSFNEAQQAAAAGDWREAIRLAYWWGIHELEVRGTWRPDAARTPREYLRLASVSRTQAPPLQALTQLVERVWYAGEPADASGFDEAVSHLKQLGCLHV